MKNARSKPGAQTPETPLPEAMELAKLAAILCPKAQPGIETKRAILRAMDFYSEALLFVARRSLSQPAKATTLKKMAYAAQPYAAYSEVAPEWSKTLELVPTADTDEVRKYLKQKGCKGENDKVWNGLTVLRKIREICGQNAYELLGTDNCRGRWARVDWSAKWHTELAVLNTLLAENRHNPSTRAGLEQRAQTVQELLDDESTRPRPAWRWVDDKKRGQGVAKHGRVERLKERKQIYDIPIFVFDLIVTEWKADERKRKREWAQKHRKKHA
jgi:hypothetical protein